MKKLVILGSKARIVSLAIIFLLLALPNAVANAEEVKPGVDEILLKQPQTPSIEEMYEWGKELSDPSMNPRAPGTVKLDRATGWIKDKLQSFGLEVWMEPQNFLGVFPQAWELKVLSPVEKEIICYPQKHVGFGDFSDVELVDVGFGLPGNYVGKDVEGKVALVDFESQDYNIALGQVGRPVARVTHGLIPLEHGIKWHYDIALDHGVIGMVSYYSGMPGNTILWSSLGFPSNQEQLKLPQLTVGREDGLYLKHLCKRGSVKIRFLNEGTTHVSTARLIIGVLPGKTEDVFIFTTRYDSPFSGAGGSTFNIVGALGVAKYFSQFPSEEREKTLIFIFEPANLYTNCNVASLLFMSNHPDIPPRIACAFRFSDPDYPLLTWPPMLIPVVGGKLLQPNFTPIRYAAISENLILWPIVLKNLAKYGLQMEWPSAWLVWPSVFLSWCGAGAIRNVYRVPTVEIMGYFSWHTFSTEDTWDYIPPDLLYRTVMVYIGMIKDLDPIPADLIRGVDLPLKPLFGCGTYFPEEPVCPGYPPGESYEPELGEPLLVGGFYTPLHWELSPYDSFIPTQGE